jgi:hypothetical protein
MEATWRQPQTLKGLSSFLVEHEPCGAGFDVSHPAGLGSGRVSMTCRGCGANYEYATATIEFEREVEFEPIGMGPRADAAPAPPPPPAYVAQPAAPEIEAPAVEAPTDELEAAAGAPVAEEAEKEAKKPPPGGRRPSKRWTRDRLITAGLLLFSAAALVFAVIRIAGDSGSTDQAETTPPAVTTPAKHAKPAPTAPPAEPTAAKPKPKPAKPKQPPAPAPETRVVKTERFAVTVPKGWKQQAASGGGTLLAPPGEAPVSLQIFYEDDPSLSAGKMSVQTAGFLRSRDPEAAVSAAKTLRIAGDPAFEVSANGPAGTQTALGVVADPYRYLAIVSADPGTSKSLRATARQALHSFEPR